jgi:hypothetical protein
MILGNCPFPKTGLSNFLCKLWFIIFYKTITFIIMQKARPISKNCNRDKHTEPPKNILKITKFFDHSRNVQHIQMKMMTDQ